MANRKRIAFYCDVDIYSGHDIMSAHIANVASTRHDVHFFYAHDAYRDSLAPTVTQRPLAVSNFGTGLADLFLKSWRFIFSVRRQFRELRPDAIIICQGEYHMCLKGLIAALLARTSRIVCYIPIGYPYSINQNITMPFKRALYRFLIRRFEAFITISVEQQQLVREYIGVERPIHVLENLTEFPALTIKRKKRRYVAYGIVSRLQHSKGQYKTLELAEKVGRHRKDFKFLFFGEGEDEARLKQAIEEKKLGDHFEFRGWVNDRAIIYSDIDVLLILSEVEGVPLVFLESLFFETPVLANHLKGNPIYERYIDRKLIVNSVDELAAKMIDIETYQALFKKRSAAYKKLVIERHGRKSFERELLVLIEKI